MSPVMPLLTLLWTYMYMHVVGISQSLKWTILFKILDSSSWQLQLQKV